MTPEDAYSRWKSRRTQVDLDSDFAGRVMERIGEANSTEYPNSLVVRKSDLHRFAWRVPMAAAVFVLALGIGLIRTGSLVLFLLLSTSQGY